MPYKEIKWFVFSWAVNQGLRKPKKPAPEHPCLTNKYHSIRRSPLKSGLTAERWRYDGPSHTLQHACLAARIHRDTLGLEVSVGHCPHECFSPVSSVQISVSYREVNNKIIVKQGNRKVTLYELQTFLDSLILGFCSWSTHLPFRMEIFPKYIISMFLNRMCWGM